MQISAAAPLPELERLQEVFTFFAPSFVLLFRGKNANWSQNLTVEGEPAFNDLLSIAVGTWLTRRHILRKRFGTHSINLARLVNVTETLTWVRLYAQNFVTMTPNSPVVRVVVFAAQVFVTVTTVVTAAVDAVAANLALKNYY
jgi:hypothetical protein